MKAIALIVFCMLLTGCASSGVDNSKAIVAAVANPARSDADRALDDKRQPAAVLAFFGIEPGMDVLDVFAGGGYYSEIISYLVGPNGSVTLYNNNPWDDFVAKRVDERLAGDRLPNVSRVTLVPAELSSIGQQHDAAIFILGMHDLYYEDVANGWPRINVARFLADINRLIKPGGVFGIVDHNARAGTDPEEVGERLHRIDPAVIIRDVEAAGFTFEGASNVLANPQDDLTQLVFDDSIRWQSDRSVLKFRKPR